MLLLLASDVIPLRQRLCLLLEQEAYKVVLAESPDSALKAMARQPQFDVVICEWKFGDGTLLDLRNRSQHLNYVSDNGNDLFSPHWIVMATPRYGQSSTVRTSQVSEIRTFGFEDVFEKPINSLVLLERLAEIRQERIATSTTREAATSLAAENNRSEAAPSLEVNKEVASIHVAKLEKQLMELQQDNDAQSQRLRTLLDIVQGLKGQAVDPGVLSHPA